MGDRPAGTGRSDPIPEGAIPKLLRESLAEQVRNSLLAYIRSQNLKPGDALPAENTLAAEFGVSRPVIREALSALQGMAIIEISKGKGAVIRALDRDPLVAFFRRAVRIDYATLSELLEFRKAIEGCCASLAAQRRDSDQLSEMTELVRQMRASFNDPDAYTSLDARFHAVVTEAAHNPLLLQVMESVREATTESIREGRRHMHSPEEMELVQSLHENLLRHIQRRHGTGARRAMDAHFEEAVLVLGLDAPTHDALPHPRMSRRPPPVVGAGGTSRQSRGA